MGCFFQHPAILCLYPGLKDATLFVYPSSLSPYIWCIINFFNTLYCVFFPLQSPSTLLRFATKTTSGNADLKIKKLTIHGFKSFVDKVTLHFPMGTSGIIGPNGCGKSNIVDSIRWVLGEQNARHLRGKHMEDIIFNGSDSRKPLGMAEVVLTFSNEEGQAPARFANFTEIEISRRLYRSGESEYYINKVQSRLRDVVDLFTDTGIGTRAYSIIEQGQVGWLINARSEERRVILEEAAGINKFKHKKEAALRRLESTKENLTRVNDIISEVKRQLNSLNRQAKKAERYKVLREELKGIELLLSSLELKKLKDELASSVKRLDSI